MKSIYSILFILFVVSTNSLANNFETDTFKTSKGNLEITFIGHGTLMMKFENKIIHIDPVSRFADYGTLPKADLILITHEHGDHLDAKAINALKKENTEIVLPPICAEKYKGTALMKNGDSGEFAGLKVDAVPAYNIKNTRADGTAFHPKGRGNGYVIYFGNKKVYVAGDTENIPEMAELESIDIAFLPMNLPYTMSPEMVANAAKLVMPKILYPYHFGETNTTEIIRLLKDENQIEVRIRRLK